jgi:4-nitrophenyl phosphatase
LITTPDVKLLQDLERVKSYIIDMDGVIYRGNTCLPHVPEFLGELDRHGIPYLMATNNSMRTPQQFADKLAGMGISLDADRILTSSVATAGWIRDRYPEGTRVFVVGMASLQQAVFGDGYFVQAGKDAEVVVSGADFELTYDKLKTACLAIRAGASYVATNGDTTFPTEEGIIPGAGAIIAALRAATGVDPDVVGKPSTGMIEEALQHLGTTPEETVMLGDRLDTDILAGERAGLLTLLVMTGVTAPDELASSAIVPDLVVDDLEPLVAFYRSKV